jgi:hypothetical protein
MKRVFLSYLFLVLSVFCFKSFSQTEDQELLGLPGDNLDLFAVLNLFQKSKTIEDFEKALNLESTGINNLDLNNDNKVDFIKVETEQDDDDFMFILRDAISEKETQDVAVIYVSKNERDNITLQIVGNENLYGKDYIVEPKTESTPPVTANPAYTGDQPVTVNVPATEVVVVQSAPIVQYVYSPAYVPYYPPYYYGYYPPYYAAFTVMAVGIYRHNNYYHHHGYNNTIIIHNHNQYNHYNNNYRNNSTTVNTNIRNGNYNTTRRGSTTTRPSTTPTRTSTTARPSTTPTRASTTARPSTTRPSASNSTGSRTRSNYVPPSSKSRSSSTRSRSRVRG